LSFRELAHHLFLLVGHLGQTTLYAIQPISRTDAIFLRRVHRRHPAKYRQRSAHRRQTQPP
jgi:hypothetical protein